MDAISCLVPPSSLLATSLGDAALARALQFSTMSDSASSSSGSAAGHHNQHYSPLQQQLCAADHLAYMSPPVTCESVLVSPRRSSPTSFHGVGRRHPQLAPHQGARAGKRRSRASKRAPTTYISTDPSNFRLMVQHITGAQAAEPADVLTAAFDASSSLLLPADATNTLLPAAMVDHHHHHHHQPPCFPTLDSWNVSCSVYERERNHDLL